jgi:chromate transporter
LPNCFLKLGIIGFGGPAAHIAMMRQEVVVKKMAFRAAFLRSYWTTSLIPGPNSTEMAIHIGREKAAGKG